MSATDRPDADTPERPAGDDLEQLPEGYFLIPRLLAFALTGLAGYIAIALTVLAVGVWIGLGTDSDQAEKLRQLSLTGCQQNNALRNQSNVRIPIEKIELRTAVTVGIVAKRFDLLLPDVPLDPEAARRQLDKLERVPLRNCQAAYGHP